MRAFADSQYFIALLNKRDAHHKAAIAWKSKAKIREVITTEAVLLEVANHLHLPEERTVVARFVLRLRRDPKTRIIPTSTDLFWRGFDLYCRRSDKEWSLTDCISFVVMTEERISDPLTRDHHFEQAGFVALLK
jgi:predicted nucleic acid-binding protein